MNKKLKVLSSAFCGLVLSSGLALTNVQAALAQINSAAISATSVSQENLLRARITKEGSFYWDTLEDAESHDIKVMQQSPTNPLGYFNITQYKGHFKNDQVNLKSYFKNQGIYYIRIRALDSNNNIIAHDVVFVYYDGTSTIQMDPFDEY